MNQEVRKVIKSSFCPKQKWVPDKDVQNCFKCDQKFHAIFKRKHHCRYCGQIFCNKCSDFFFQGKDLGQTESKVRMCNACYQKCWKYLFKHDQEYIQYRKSNDGSEEKIPDPVQLIEHKSSSFTEQDKLIQIRQIINEYNTNDLQGLKSLEEDANKKFTILLQVMMKQKKIPLKYLGKILEVARGVVERSPPNALITNNMDICRNIKFKCFLADEFDIKLSDRVLVKKYFQSKKLKDIYQNVCCILVYGGLESASLVGGGQKEASFEQIVNNRTKQMTKLISYCERLGEICKNNAMINLWKQGQLLYPKQKQIILESKFLSISRLKVALNIEKIVESVHQLYNYTKAEIVGQVQVMTTETYISIKDTTKVKKFYGVKSFRDELGMVVLIMGKQKQLLESIKNQFNWIIMCLRHIKLKIHKVLLDQTLLNSMNEQMRNDCYLNNPEMFFSFYNEHHSDIINYLKQKYLSYKQISYYGSDFQHYPEVNKLNLDEYLKNRTHSFRNRWDYFTQICGEINDEHKLFYSNDDTPIGVYLLKKITSIDKKCNRCCRPNSTHIDVFYSTDHFVKIWTESRILYLPSELEEHQLVLEQFSDLQMMFESLSKESGKSKMECFIQCQKCQQVLSDRIKLSRQHLQYSMVAFLNHFFKGTTETVIRQSNVKQKAPNKQSACNHKDKTRVFSLGDKAVKILVGSFTLNRLCTLTTTGREQYLRKKELLFCNSFCVLQNNKIEQFVNFLHDEVKTIAESCKNSKFQRMIRDPRASFISAKKSILANCNSKLSQAQCLDMILPELIEQLNKITMVSMLLLNTKKLQKYFECLRVYHVITNILKRSYVILTELKRSIKRRQLQMKFNASDFDNEFIMEEVDLSSIDQSSLMDESNQNQSDISKGEHLSTNYDLEKSDNLQNYDWMQPIETVYQLNRSERKTEYNRRRIKASEQEVARTFKQMSSCLRVEHAFLQYVPAFPHLPQTLIASALNSQIHKECIEQTHHVQKQLLVRMTRYLEGEIRVEQEQLKKLQIVLEVHQRMFNIADKVKKNPQVAVNFQVTFLYPSQFQLLRRKKNIQLKLFIESVGGAEAWMASGGKSGSSFMRSFNDLIVIKRVTIKQFTAFRKFLPKYFTHLHQGSLLVPIYGAYIVTKNGNSQYYVVMENLFFGMKNWYLYDFKGSVTRRFSKWPVIPLDVNFLIDRNSEPIFCKDNVLKDLLASLEYLTENKIVDYSLILVVQIENEKDYYLDGNRFHIGIVDYLRQFGAMERVERTWKGQQATVQQPADYKNRLFRNLKKYFTQIPL